jgi:predicted nucleic acid-binding protein
MASSDYPRGKRRNVLRATAEELFADFRRQVLAFDESAAARYATVVAERDRVGLPINGFDGQIAAICLDQQASLATRNVKDFAGTGVAVIDPFR